MTIFVERREVHILFPFKSLCIHDYDVDQTLRVVCFSFRGRNGMHFRENAFFFEGEQCGGLRFWSLYDAYIDYYYYAILCNFSFW